MEVQPGQSHSWQAGSEPCLSPGDWRGMKRRQRGCGPRGFSSEIFLVAEAEAVSLAEGSIWTTARARSSGAAGVPSPGHAFKGFPRNLGDLLVSSCERRERFTRQQRTRPWPVWMHRGGERRSIRRKGYQTVEGDRRLFGTGERGVLRSHITNEGGELAKVGTHWREGVNWRTYRAEET